jgi:hypothetical protein
MQRREHGSRRIAGSVLALVLGACADDPSARGLGHGWADVGEGDDGDDDDTGTSAEDCDALEDAALELLDTRCAGCHTGANAAAPFDDLYDLDRLITEGKLLPGDAEHSRLVVAMEAGTMPPPSAGPPLQGDEIAAVRGWIDACLHVPDCSPDHAIRTDGALEIMRADISDPSRVDLEDRRFVRYLSLVHLYDAGTCGHALDPHRRALTKAINSLSRGSSIVAPVPIDADDTIFRIDVRDYGWNAGTWAAIVAADPYAIDYTRDDAVDLQTFTECAVPMVRGDWFAAMATAPPLYHELLDLPDTRFLLEAELEVDVLGDVVEERAARAGLFDSGMATNHRLVQRHDVPGASGRAYWVSYDFAAATGAGNLAAHPLDFAADTRLHMFGLDNGLLGFLVTDAEGARLDWLPDTIAQDPAEPSGDVVNGRSCLRCHDRGVVPAIDELRVYVVDGLEFDDATKEKIERLHPEAEEWLELQAADSAGYVDALARAGVPVAIDEPIGEVYASYHEPVDLARAAAELGIAEDQLLVEIGGLSAALQPLVDTGVAREVFAAEFAAAACELALGHTRECPP